MLTALGSSVTVTLEGGRRVRLPGVMLFDETGRAWPRCSILFGQVKRSGRPLAGHNGFGEKWYGRNYEQKEGDIALPPRALGEWEELDRALRIDYVRSGEAHPGAFKHAFRQRTLLGKELVVMLRRHGAFSRLDLRGGCIDVSWRGILSP